MSAFSKIFCLILLSLNINTQFLCPNYTCDRRQENSCVYVQTGAHSTNSNSITLTDICNSDEFCNVPQPQSDILSKEQLDSSYTCVKRTKITPPRYPGENCNEDADCLASSSTTGRCINNKCSGVAEQETCYSSMECLKGLYCDMGQHKCFKQKPVNVRCYSSSECENKYLCHESRCGLKPFSLDIGSEIKDNSDMFNFAKCQLGFMDMFNRCSMLSQDEPNEGEFIKCIMGEKCFYKIVGTDYGYGKDCGCGYNSTGQGYCTKGHNNSNFCFN
jgi:hypothetical protein